MPALRLLLVVLLAVALAGVAPRPATAQDGTGLTLGLVTSTTKARIGDFVGFTVRLENTGTEVIPALSVTLGLPDALDARVVSCPGDSHGIVTFCELGEFAPGTIAEVLFVVQVGSRVTNGPVTAFASSGDTVLASATLPALKIVGPRRR